MDKSLEAKGPGSEVAVWSRLHFLCAAHCLTYDLKLACDSRISNLQDQRVRPVCFTVKPVQRPTLNHMSDNNRWVPWSHYGKCILPFKLPFPLHRLLSFNETAIDRTKLSKMWMGKRCIDMKQKLGLHLFSLKKRILTTVKETCNSNKRSWAHRRIFHSDHLKRCFTRHISTWHNIWLHNLPSAGGTSFGQDMLVLPMHICLRSKVLQLPFSGWASSVELEDTEPVPYSTRVNWVKVPVRRNGDKIKLTQRQNRPVKKRGALTLPKVDFLNVSYNSRLMHKMIP